ncbi:MAG: hypothetical protein U0176_11560 [Bacteroidia bacterium]
MRRKLWLLCLSMTWAFGLMAQPAAHGINTGEYFWDTDPGTGNGIAVTAADGTFDEVIEGVLANAANFPAPAGSHRFFVRVQDANGTWSPAFSTIVERGTTTASNRTTQVIVAEYFWDTDPGAGNGSPMIALDGNLDEVVEAISQVITMPAQTGPHSFNVRVQDSDNQWSPVFTTILEGTPSGSTLRLTYVAQAEYFWDTDPGQGNGSVLLALDGNLDEIVEALLGDNLNFPASPGGHMLGIRVKDASNLWSDVFGMMVYRDQNTTSNRSTAVVQAEYYWDTDPGAGNGSPLLALDGNLNEVVEGLVGSSITIPGIAGPHNFAVRVLDADGSWSDVFETTVYKDSITNATRLSRIVQGEYFWDTEPGLGLGQPFLAEDGNLDEEVESLLDNLVGFPNPVGPHTFNCRVKDVNGNWSDLFTTTVERESLTTSTRATSVVQAEYFWDADPGQGNGTSVLALDGNLNEVVESLTRSIGTLSMSGGPHKLSIRVRDTDTNWSSPFSTAIFVQGGGFPVDSIAGPKDYCGTVPATNQTYLVDTTGISGNSFSWTVLNGVITTGQGTRQVAVTWTAGQSLYTIQCVTCFFGSCDTILDTVTVHPLPIANAGPDVAICIGSNTQLSGSGGNLYAWTPGTGLSSTSIANPVATPTVTTTYTLTVTDLNGCSGTDQVVVTVNPLPSANAGADVIICTGGSTTLNATGGVSYSWTPTTGLGSPNSASTTASPSATTTYTVTVTDANGCVKTDAVVVTVDPGPTVSAGADRVTCSGVGVTLLGSSGHSSYSWSPSTGLSATNVQTPVLTLTAATQTNFTYTLTATNANGCPGTDQVVVTINPLPTVNAGNDVAICSGSNTTLTATGAATYGWSPSTGLNTTGTCCPVASPTATTTYTVTGTSSFGCVNSDQVVVTVNPLPIANAGQDATICSGGNTQLQASGGVTYAWSPSNGLSSTTISNPVASPLANTTYTVTVTDANGCTSTDAVIVGVTVRNPALGKAVLAAEYFWDTDPGQGNGFALTAADGGFNEAVEAVLANGINMLGSAGLVFYVRSRTSATCGAPRSKPR